MVLLFRSSNAVWLTDTAGRAGHGVVQLLQFGIQLIGMVTVTRPRRACENDGNRGERELIFLGRDKEMEAPGFAR